MKTFLLIIDSDDPGDVALALWTIYRQMWDEGNESGEGTADGHHFSWRIDNMEPTAS